MGKYGRAGLGYRRTKPADEPTEASRQVNFIALDQTKRKRKSFLFTRIGFLARLAIVGYPAAILTKIPKRFNDMRSALFLAALLALAPVPALAEDMPVYKLVAKDGVFDPATIEVAAGKKFTIELTNAGSGPMEFESKDLKQEKVLAKGAKSSIVINALKPGTYTFFDEHKPDAPKGKIVAK